MTAQQTLDEIHSAQQDLDTASPQEILRWAVNHYGDQLAIVTSFQITGIVTLHMLSEITNNINVMTLDTGLLFPETYQLIDTVEAQLGVKVKRIKPELSLTQQARTEGSLLWETDPNRCCNVRKQLPLTDALKGHSAWVTGLRRDQSPTRANTPVIDWDDRYNMVKVCPFATWTEDMLWTYINAYDLPYNTLHDRGYASIGCYTCTMAGDGREGRWSNLSKTECGIHFAQPVAELSHASVS